MNASGIVRYESLAEAEGAIRRHFRARDEGRGLWGRQVRLRRQCDDLLSTGEMIYVYRWRGEEIGVLVDGDGYAYV